MKTHISLHIGSLSGSQSLALVLPSLQSLPLIWPAALPQLEGLWKSSQPHPQFLGGELIKGINLPWFPVLSLKGRNGTRLLIFFFSINIYFLKQKTIYKNFQVKYTRLIIFSEDYLTRSLKVSKMLRLTEPGSCY